jgi:hypothetical protein
MVPALRNLFNDAFTEAKHANYLHTLNSKFEGAIDFRVAETPVFLDNHFNQQMLDTCSYIIDVINDQGFIQKTNASVPANKNVPAQTAHPNFLAFDFGICTNEQNQITPHLIEMQGFPSLYGYQDLQHDA